MPNDNASEDYLCIYVYMYICKYVYMYIDQDDRPDICARIVFFFLKYFCICFL